MKVSSESRAVITDVEVREYFAQCRTLIDERLGQLIPPEGTEPNRIHSAIRWSLMAGGKRLRPTLLLAVGQTLDVADNGKLLPTACAFEMLHTYSLIHDDLPAMDDDNLRRGRPTVHVRFDEATAILAGDALQTLAFQTIAEDSNLSVEVRVRLISEVARASGTPEGMLAGQGYDLASAAGEVTSDELERIHHYKTGALIIAAARCGAIIAGARAPELEAIIRYAASLGLLFQITDDLLDVTATIEDLGKTPGKDARADKATYPALYGLDATRELALAVNRQAHEALDTIERPTQLLHSIADFILRRRG